MAKPKSYNVFSELRANIDDFDGQGVYLVGKPHASDDFEKSNRGVKGGYYYSQRDTLEAVDLATASKFKHGTKDVDGKRKTFINIVNFHKDVSLNQINVNVANYILMPTEDIYAWPVTFTDKKFKEWADENSYDDIIDETADDYVGRGSAVSKRVRGSVERVPLRTLRNTQTARSLKQAALNGGYVIIENEMAYSEMQKYPGWNLKGLDSNKSYVAFERYSLVPKGLIMSQNQQQPAPEDWETRVLALQVLLPDVAMMDARAGEEKGHIAFIEELSADDFPLEEVHYARIDGRWLGRGEVEKQLENQIARNLTANLRRRSLLWAVKKIFQSSDPDVKRNLLTEVADGEVLEVKQNGNISPVNTQTQHLGDFQADENTWKENSQQISFSFEAASGEGMPSGTPFRLGVLLTGAVSKYFKRKQDTLSNYLKRSFFNQILPTFRKENKDAHTLVYSPTDENYDMVKEAMTIIRANEMVHDSWSKRIFITFEQAKAKVEKEMQTNPLLFIDVPDSFYKEPQCYMRLNINEPIAADIETLSNLYTIMSKNGDPRADKILKQILSTRGTNLDALAGMGKAPAKAAPADQTQPANPLASIMAAAGAPAGGGDQGESEGAPAE